MTTKTIFLIGGPNHGETLCIKAGTHLLIDDRTQATTEVAINEVIVNDCSFYVARHPDATPAQTNEVMAKLEHLSTPDHHLTKFADYSSLVPGLFP